MRKTKKVVSLYVLIFTSLSAMADKHSNADVLPISIEFQIFDRLQDDGSNQIQLYTAARGPSTFSTLFKGGQAVSGPYLFTSYEELNELLFGEWEVRLHQESNPAAFESYSFSILPFDLDDLTYRRPTIIEPTSNFVAPSFRVVWEPAGFHVMNWGNWPLTYRDFESNSIDFKAWNPQNRNFGSMLFGISGELESLSQFITTPVSADGSTSYQFEMSLEYSQGFETTIHIRFVPEPRFFYCVTMLLLSMLTRIRVSGISA